MVLSIFLDLCLFLALMILCWVVLVVTNDGDVLCCSEGQAELSGVSSNVTPSTSLGPDHGNTTDISQIIMGI